MSNYAAQNIKVLKKFEPVQKRPAMYTRVDDPLHILQEVVDNAVDEAMAGFCTTITVTAGKDGFFEVSDNGRGIPVELHPEEKIPTVELVFTELHAGGKFDKQDAGNPYAFAGGLHGVGVTVTNALSERLEVTIKKGGSKYFIAFENGPVKEPLKELGATRGTGTSVRFKPNPSYFSSPEIPLGLLEDMLKTKAMFLPALTITLVLEATGEKKVFQYADGLAAYLEETALGDPIVPPLQGKAFMSSSEELDGFAKGEGAEWVFSWYEAPESKNPSFVNLIHTPQGGTHVAGLRSALFNAVKSFIEHHAMAVKGLKLAPEDVFKNVHYVLAAKMLDPSFDNQTKDRLNSRNAVRLIEKIVQPQLEAWLNHNPVHAKTVADLALRNAHARAKQTKQVEKRKSSSVVMLPGKLSDCESSNPDETELFLVEGDSAGGSAKMGRDKNNQAILPLRGKVLNTFEADAATALGNTEIHSISVATGIPLHGLKDTVDWTKIRYGKICILSDADVDGFHIQTLLLTLFYKHFPQLIDRGHVYVAQTPLFRLDVDKLGKKPAKKLYLMDEQERDAALDKVKKEGYTNFRISRFKGLGEMNPDELKETALNPDTRRLLRVELPADLIEAAKSKMHMLFAKNESDLRKVWLEENGSKVREM